MRVEIERMLPMGLRLGVAVVMVVAVTFWMQGRNSLPSGYIATEPKGMNATQMSDAKIKSGRPDRSASEQDHSNVKTDRGLLRSQLDQPDQNLTSRADSTDQIYSKPFVGLDVPAGEEGLSDPAQDPRHEIEQADALMEAQVNLLEKTILAEKIDPQWSGWAELNLTGAYGSEKVAGLQLEDVVCRSTMCRLVLSFDGSVSPEQSFRGLSSFSPWPGSGFVRIGGVEGEERFSQVVIYLTREGHSLPQLAQ